MLHSKEPLSQVNSCLFTDAPLTATTKVEHTIPEGLGGRIRSRIVSSDEFNQNCGSWVDNFLVDAYSDTMATLGPLLSAEHRLGEREVEIPEADGRYAIDGLGGVFQKGSVVRKRDSRTGCPSEVAGRDKERLNTILQESDPNAQLRWTEEPSTDADFYRRRKPTIAAEIEFAALKSALLTFDHLLANSDRRFTREPALSEVREFVHQSVRTRRIDGPAMRKFSLGMQYDQVAMIHELRSSVEKPPTEFEHVLIASGNMGTRTLDLVWLVLGIDPFGFRVSYRRREPDFVCMVVNETQRGGTAHGPYWRQLPSGTSHICAPTVYRAMQHEQEMAGIDFDSVAMTIAGNRMKGQARAIALVEQTADSYVCDGLAEIAIVDHSGRHLISKAIRERLRRLFVLRLNDPMNLNEFERIVCSQLEGARDDRVSSDVDKTAVCWESWLRR